MTAMFQPPIAVTTEIGWTQMLGFGQHNDAFFGRVRGAQLAAVNRYVPFNAALMTANILSIAWSLRAVGMTVFLLGWIGVLAGLGAVWLLRWRESRRSGSDPTVTQRYFWLASAEMASFGFAWAALMLNLMPLCDFEQQAALLLLSLAAMGSCGFSTAVTPACAAFMVFSIGVSSLAAIPAASPLNAAPIAIAFLTYMAIIVRGVVIASFALMERMRTQAELGESTAIAKLLLVELDANGSDWLIEVDTEARLTHVSPRMAEAARMPRAALMGLPLLSLIGDRRAGDARTAAKALSKKFRSRQVFRDCVVPVRIDGELRWWSISGTPKHDSAGNFAGYRGVGKDITDMRRGQERIAELARFDPLTGLASRTLLREKLDDALARATRTGKSCALLFVDLDRFKGVNDSRGHAAGDALLREAAGRLRQAAGAGVRVGRLGGDEFAIVLDVASPRRAEAVARAVVAALSRPFEIDGGLIGIGASAGFAIGPEDGATTEALLRAADLALHEVKASGRGTACRFQPELGTRSEERRALEADLACALDRGELALAFQPVVDASDEQVTGFEALLRWHHPVLGLVPPSRFIPIAEGCGAIVPIGHWVIRTACAWAARWPGHVKVAVNLSPAQFEDPLLVDCVRQALADHGLAAERLELEITESLFLNEKPATIERLAGLKALGIRFALDDFGTGYSSLGYLRKASFSRIKIDRSFVSRLSRGDAEATAIIQAIVSLAKSLDMATTAEGTETRAEFEACRDLGCAQIQGYYFGRPMPPEEATALVCGVRAMAAA